MNTQNQHSQMKAVPKPSQQQHARAKREAEAQHFFVPYLEHAKTLRTWFVGYGIGAVVLFINQNQAWAKVVSAGYRNTAPLLFLAGVFIQILVTFTVKTVMHNFYWEERDHKYRSKWIYRCSKGLSEHFFWYLPLADIITIAFFGIATVLVFIALARPS